MAFRMKSDSSHKFNDFRLDEIIKEAGAVSASKLADRIMTHNIIKACL